MIIIMIIIIVVISIARNLIDKDEHTTLYKIGQTYKYTHKPIYIYILFLAPPNTHTHTHTHTHTNMRERRGRIAGVMGGGVRGGE